MSRDSQRVRCPGPPDLSLNNNKRLADVACLGAWGCSWGLEQSRACRHRGACRACTAGCAAACVGRPCADVAGDRHTSAAAAAGVGVGGPASSRAAAGLPAFAARGGPAASSAAAAVRPAPLLRQAPRAERPKPAPAPRPRPAPVLVGGWLHGPCSFRGGFSPSF